MKALSIITLVLIIVGGLNWALVGLAGFDLVAFITGSSFGGLNIFSRIIYLLVGASAVFQAIHLAGMAHHHGQEEHHAMA
jgi:hypothetical protein